jgi:hypothetical protein
MTSKTEDWLDIMYEWDADGNVIGRKNLAIYLEIDGEC